MFIKNIIFIKTVFKKIIFPHQPVEIIPEIVESRYSRSSFHKIMDKKGFLLDVGCGNNSPYIMKVTFPDIYYTGIDIGDYNQKKPNLADEYIITEPDKFADAILNLEKEYDTVICSHNLEHCNDRDKTLIAITKVLKSGGYLFLSFPTEKSVNFPGPRKGCLNYYDDSSHKDLPPDFRKTIKTLQQAGMKILFSSKSYKPFRKYILGLLMEKESKKDKEVKDYTWAYWGFEAIIWAKKK
jgi:ubiquinone/menaquinone biosynthesis C-methylase UbiE